MRINWMVGLAVTLFFPLALAIAQETQAANQLPQEALQHIQTAQELMTHASQSLAQNPNDRGTIQTAIGLYASAGEHFEKTSKIFETLGPNGVSESDVAGVNDAIQSCLNTIARLRGRLNRM